MHGPRYHFVVFSAACFACTALVIFFSLCGRLIRLHGPRYLFFLFSAAYFACTALVIFSHSFRTTWVSFCCSLPLLGLSWEALGRSWGSLGRLLAALGPLLAALGRSWEPLGSLLAPLGLLLDALRTILEQHAKIIKKSNPKMTDLGSQKGSQMAPKSIPKRTKIDDKNQCEKNTSSRPSWSRLGTILGCFGTALGLIFIDFLLVFKAFREQSRFSKNIVSRRVLSPTWPILDRFWHPKWLQNGSQNGSKTI